MKHQHILKKVYKNAQSHQISLIGVLLGCILLISCVAIFNYSNQACMNLNNLEIFDIYSINCKYSAEKSAQLRQNIDEEHLNLHMDIYYMYNIANLTLTASGANETYADENWKLVVYPITNFFLNNSLLSENLDFPEMLILGENISMIPDMLSQVNLSITDKSNSGQILLNPSIENSSRIYCFQNVSLAYQNYFDLLFQTNDFYNSQSDNQNIIFIPCNSVDLNNYTTKLSSLNGELKIAIMNLDDSRFFSEFLEIEQNLAELKSFVEDNWNLIFYSENSFFFNEFGLIYIDIVYFRYFTILIGILQTLSLIIILKNNLHDFHQQIDLKNEILELISYEEQRERIEIKCLQKQFLQKWLFSNIIFWIGLGGILSFSLFSPTLNPIGSHILSIPDLVENISSLLPLFLFFFEYYVIFLILVGLLDFGVYYVIIERKGLNSLDQRIPVKFQRIGIISVNAVVFSLTISYILKNSIISPFVSIISICSLTWLIVLIIISITPRIFAITFEHKLRQIINSDKLKTILKKAIPYKQSAISFDRVLVFLLLFNIILFGVLETHFIKSEYNTYLDLDNHITFANDPSFTEENMTDYFRENNISRFYSYSLLSTQIYGIQTPQILAILNFSSYSANSIHVETPMNHPILLNKSVPKDNYRYQVNFTPSMSYECNSSNSLFIDSLPGVFSRYQFLFSTNKIDIIMDLALFDSLNITGIQKLNYTFIFEDIGGEILSDLHEKYSPLILEEKSDNFPSISYYFFPFQAYFSDYLIILVLLLNLGLLILEIKMNMADIWQKWLHKVETFEIFSHLNKKQLKSLINSPNRFILAVSFVLYIIISYIAIRIYFFIM